MTSPGIRYLLAKRSVDDRALNPSVVDALRSALLREDRDAPRRVLEIGAGAGTMIERALEWNLFRNVEYTAVDADGEALAEAERALPEWARRRGMRVEVSGDALVLRGRDHRALVRFRCADLFAYESEGAPADLLVANAVLDLVDVETALPRLWSHLQPGGLFWFTINFDGETIFLPERDPEFEGHLIELYHRSMDMRSPDGSRTGRRLFTRIPASGARIHAAGASDWVVHPVGGAYPSEEAAFLHHILDTIGAELESHPQLDPASFRDWLGARRADVDAAELVFIAHQLDFLGRAPGP